MAIHGDVVATVSPKKLEIYVLDHDGNVCASRRIQHFELPYPFGFVALSFDRVTHHMFERKPRCAVLRLFLNCGQELHLHELLIPPRLEDLHFRKVWKQKAAGLSEAFNVGFGARPSTLTWLGGKRRDWEPVTFVTAFLPLGLTDDWENPDTAECVVKAHTFSGSDLPALFAMSVRDFDETSGLLLVGNAFGELTLHAFSGSDVACLSQCFVRITFPDLHSEEYQLGATVSVLSCHILMRGADEA